MQPNSIVIPAKAGIQLDYRTLNEEKQPAVYILSNAPRGTIYVGVTASLWNRISTHNEGSVEGFSLRYKLKDLVWYEHHSTMESAIRREKQIKKWNRNWKIQMIESFNPHWIDLHDAIDLTVQFDESKLDSRFRGNDEWKC